MVIINERRLKPYEPLMLLELLKLKAKDGFAQFKTTELGESWNQPACCLNSSSFYASNTPSSIENIAIKLYRGPARITPGKSNRIRKFIIGFVECYIFAGQIAGAARVLTQKEYNCIETKCTSRKGEYCEFRLRDGSE